MGKAKTLNNVVINMTLKSTQTRAKLSTSSEDLAVQMGKINKWYDSLVPTGGASGNILEWDSDGVAKWVTPSFLDEKVKTTLLAQSTAEGSYRPTFVTGAGTGGVNIIDSFKVNHSPGTTSAVGNTRLILGNATASGTANNEEGQLKLYSSGTSFHTLKGTTVSSEVIHVLPSTGGTVLNHMTTTYTQTVASSVTGAYEIGKIKINGTTTTIYGHDVDTTYTATDGIKIESNVIKHTNAITSAASVFKKISYDAQGHITGTANVTASDIPALNYIVKPGQVGSASRPIYINNSSVPTQCDTPTSGAYWAGVPYVGSNGVMEIGKYIDFHGSNTSTNDYDYRISAETQILYFAPKSSGDATYNLIRMQSPDYNQIQFQTTKSGKAYTSTGIVAYPLTTSGQTMLIQSDGNTVVGGGESPRTLYSNSYDNMDTAENETLYLASDSSEIHFVTNCQAYSGRKVLKVQDAQLVKTGGQWISARDTAPVYANKPNAQDGGYYPAWFAKTKSGGWSMGVLSAQDNLYITYTTDTDYSGGTNNNTYQVQFQNKSGTVALTSDLAGYVPMETVTTDTSADNYFTKTAWVNWNKNAGTSTTNLPTANWGILITKSLPSVQMWIPDNASGIYFRRKADASTAATAWWGITGTSGTTYNLANISNTGFGYRTLNATTVNTTAGSFVFGGDALLGGVNDWAGIQVEGINDRFQLLINGHLLVRQNDDATISAAGWTAWTSCLRPADVSGSGGITVTQNNVTIGSGSTAVTYKGTVTISHSNSITASTSTVFKKFSYDANGHITGTAAVAASDLPSHTHDYLPTTTKYAIADSVGGSALYGYVPRVTKNSRVFAGNNKAIIEEYTADSGSTNLPTQHYYHILSIQGPDTNWGTQLALGMTTHGIYYRRYYSGTTWTDWTNLLHVVQTSVGSTYTNFRPLLIGESNSATQGFTPSTVTGGAYATSTIYCKPSDGTIYATTFNGNATRSSALYTTGIGSSSSTHAGALQTYFEANKSTIVRNQGLGYYSSSYSNGSFYFGYFLSGYDSNPYGGFFVCHYNTPYYVGIQNGTYVEHKLLTDQNYTSSITQLGTVSKGSTTKGIYLDAGVPKEMTYSLNSTVNSGTANCIAYYSGANAISSAAKVTYVNANNSASTPATVAGLHIESPTYGNTAANMLGGVAGVFSYGDGGPQIRFKDGSSSQAGALIFTADDAAATGTSWHFVSNESDWNVISKRFHAKTSISIGTDKPSTSYNLSVTGTSYFTNTITIKGTSSGNASINYASYGNTRNYTSIKFYDGNASGQGVQVGGGGLTVIGGGESAQAVFDNLSTLGWSAADEVAIVASDGPIYFMSNCDTFANRKSINIDTSGYLNTSYINMNISDQDNQFSTASSIVYSNSDKYLRRVSLTTLGSTLGPYVGPYVTNVSDGSVIHQTNYNSAGGTRPVHRFIRSLRTNKLAFTLPANITMEYSTNSGSSWTSFGYTDAQKAGPFISRHFGGSIAIGPTSGERTTSMQTRITITNDGRDCYIDQFYIWMSTSGHGTTVDIQYTTQSAKTTWVDWRTGVGLAGWSGPNVINVSELRYGNTIYSIRFIFKITSISADYKTQPGTIYDIQAYGAMACWTSKNNMMMHDSLYTWDHEQVATFPAEVKVHTQLRVYHGNYGTILRSDGSDTYILLTDSGSAENGTWNNLRPFQISNSTGMVYLKQGVQVSSTSYGALSVIRAGSTNNAGIKFYNNGSTYLGSLALGSVNGTFVRFKDDESTAYEIIDRSVVTPTPSSTVTTNWNTASERTIVVTKGWMSYWNGAYNGSSSNLAYCNKGAFGTIITHDEGDYVKTAYNQGAYGTDYGILFTNPIAASTDTGGYAYRNAEMRAKFRPPSSSARGWAEIYLGNAETTNASGSTGWIGLYNASGKLTDLSVADGSSDTTQYFPNVSGTILNSGNYLQYTRSIQKLYAATSTKGWRRILTIPASNSSGYTIGRYEFHFTRQWQNGAPESFGVRVICNYTTPIIHLLYAEQYTRILTDFRVTRSSDSTKIHFEVWYDSTSKNDFSVRYIIQDPYPIPHDYCTFPTETNGSSAGSSFLPVVSDNPTGQATIVIPAGGISQFNLRQVTGSYGGYFGMADATGSDSAWIRTTSQGLLPYQSGDGTSGGHCYLGTSGWYFANAYINRVYGNTADFECFQPRHSNEFSMKQISSSYVWFNYRLITDDKQGYTTEPTKPINQYWFGCGKARNALAKVVTSGMIIYPGAANTTSYSTTLQSSSLTANRTATLPNATGTIPLITEKYNSPSSTATSYNLTYATSFKLLMITTKPSSALFGETTVIVPAPTAAGTTNTFVNWPGVNAEAASQPTRTLGGNIRIRYSNNDTCTIDCVLADYYLQAGSSVTSGSTSGFKVYITRVIGISY